MIWGVVLVSRIPVRVAHVPQVVVVNHYDKSKEMVYLVKAVRSVHTDVYGTKPHY